MTHDELVDMALDAAHARLEEDGCDCGDRNDPPCALCLVDRALAAVRATEAWMIHDSTRGELIAALKLIVDHYGDPLGVARPAIEKAEGRGHVRAER